MVKIRTKTAQSKVDLVRATAFVGKGSCGKRDMSIHHDDYLAGLRMSYSDNCLEKLDRQAKG